jgi:hypothetical protein
MHSRRGNLLGGLAAVALGLATFAGRLEPGNVRPLDSRDAAREPRLPERPRRAVEVGPLPAANRTVHVAANGDLQAALDAAQGGDLIALEPGATYRGPFHLPRKDGDGWIVVAGRVDRLPPGRRADPAQAREMPKIVASSGDAIVVADAGAHHYRFVGVEIAPADGVFLHALVQLGSHETDRAALPHDIVVDRCYLHGDPRKGARRGVALNGRDLAIVDSYLADFKEVGADSQAIAGWNGEGPFRIANNYLEAAGENVMFGGADPAINGLVPADITIVGNHLAKPLRWKAGDASYEGTAWAVKNLFELKNARRVLVEHNLLEYNWPHAQNGFAILFTPRNQDGGAPWSVVEDVTFASNIVRHVAAALNVLGRDDIHTSEPTRRIAIQNNLFLDVGGVWGKGRFLQLLNGTEDVLVDHNTVANADGIVWGGERTPHTGFVFQNNIVSDNGAGVLAEGTGAGRPTLDRYFPNAVFRRNVIVGGKAEIYPADNFFPPAIGQVGFVGAQSGNLRLADGSTYRRAATDKRDVGADFDALREPGPTGTSGVR